MQETPSGTHYDALMDTWEKEAPIPLDGLLERHQYSPLMTIVLLLIVTFVLFQLVISPLAIIILLLVQGVPAEEFLEIFGTRIEEFGSTLLIGNTIGQIFGLALIAYLFARLNSSRPAAFLRFRGTDWYLIVLSIVGLVAIMPFVQWLATLNEMIPLPEWLRELEQSQMDLIEKILMQEELNIGFNLLVLALTPAFCEEILFRGYIQRQSERAFGIEGGILFSGITFGLFHLRISQVVPLAVLGIFLAYLAWRTGSLWPPIIVHFINNAFAVFLGAYVTSRPDLDAADIETMNVPWYFIITGLVLFVITVYLLHQRGNAMVTQSVRERPVQQKPTEIDENLYG